MVVHGDAWARMGLNSEGLRAYCGRGTQAAGLRARRGVGRAVEEGRSEEVPAGYSPEPVRMCIRLDPFPLPPLSSFSCEETFSGRDPVAGVILLLPPLPPLLDWRRR